MISLRLIERVGVQSDKVPLREAVDDPEVLILGVKFNLNITN
jgi:hypothetical protein